MQPSHLAQPDRPQPLSLFAQTLRDADEKFYATFPDAKRALEQQATYFGGFSFSYNAQSLYTGYSVEDVDRGYIDTEPYPSHRLHYDYHATPSHLASQPATAVNVSPQELYQDAPMPPTPALQLAIPSPQGQGHFPTTSQISHYSNPDMIQPSHGPVQSPAEVVSPIAFAYPPSADSPSVVVGSPIDKHPFQSIIVPSQTPERLAQQQQGFQPHHRHPHQQHSPHRSGSYEHHPPPPPGSPGSHSGHYDHLGQPMVPSQMDNHARAMQWSNPGDLARQSRPSMRLSPLPSKRQLEKKPPLACLFCRGRKIACGPPLPGSVDKTCNQCQRRSLRCEYPSESRRGMRKKKTIDNDGIDTDVPTLMASSTPLVNDMPSS